MRGTPVLRFWLSPIEKPRSVPINVMAPEDHGHAPVLKGRGGKLEAHGEIDLLLFRTTVGVGKRRRP